MNPGYYIEQDLLYQADTYGEEFWPYGPDGPSTLQKEVEKIEVVEEDDCYHIKDFLINATLMNLREGVRDYARHECQGCRIDHPSQKYHDLCLWIHHKNRFKISNTTNQFWSVSTSIMSWKTETRLSVTI